ncbi:MAG: hypothetical protein IPJ19_08515 [Planctomycetes bacterium]|nr:hypothetical protein [Planctomycetota bacterium]
MQLQLSALGLPLAAACALALPLQAQARPPELSQAMSTWQARHGARWSLVPAEGTDFAQLLYGGALASSERPANDAEFAALARARLIEARPLHGVDLETLALARVQFLPLGQIGSTDKTVVKYQQRAGGVRVVDGWVNVLFDQQGTLLSIQSSALPGLANLDVAPQLEPVAASARALDSFRTQTGREPTRALAPELVVLQHELSGRREPRLCWSIDLQSIVAGADPIGFRHYVDARTGEVLRRVPSVEFFDVTGSVHSMASPGLLPDENSNPETAQPMAYMSVSSSAGTVTTDANGNFVFPGINTPLDVTVSYIGAYNLLTNNGGAPYSLTATLQPGQANALLMNPASSATVTSQANAFRSVDALRDWVRSVNPTDSLADFVARADVNQSSTCNAFYDGIGINFFAAGGGCVNTSFSTVVSHEHGHWMNDRYGTGNGSDGMGEGNADVWSLYVWDTPTNGQDWSGPGSYVRSGNNTRQFCGDGNPACYGEVHADGEPWMGAAWKIRNRLNVAYGNAVGDGIANTIFLTWMESYNQSQIRSVIETQWLTLDDDDANLGNGTPHHAQIDGGFRDQGFPGYAIPNLALVDVTDLTDTPFEAGPYTVSAKISANANPPVASANVWYRVNGGALQSVPMSPAGGPTWTADLPGEIGPAHIEYYVQATDNAGQNAVWPPNAGQDFLDFDVGDVHVLLAQSFEATQDQGWTHGATSGTDDWQHGPANSKSGTSSGIAWADPTAGYFSSRCWGTDLGTGNSNGAYNNNCNIWLRSPVVDCTTGAGVKLRFKRWLSVQGSASDQARVRVNGAQVWINPTTNLTETGWSAQELDISALADGNPSVQIEFGLQSNASTSLGGWNVDNVALVWVERAVQPCPTPTSYCVAAPNSFDPAGATMSWSGSRNISLNDFTLVAVNAPPHKAGLFFYGQSQAQVPFGNGFRCVGTPLTRLPLVQSNDLGDMVYPLDYNSLPLSGQIHAGEVWNFALWYRDPAAGGANFNASNGLNVVFCP